MRYLKTWEAITNKIEVKIKTPKLSEERQEPYWYKDGAIIAEVTDGYHTIYIDKRGNTPMEILETGMTDYDIDRDHSLNWFTAEFWQKGEGTRQEVFYLLDDYSVPTDVNTNHLMYDSAIQYAKDGFKCDRLMNDIAEVCDCEKCIQRKRTRQFDL